MDALYVIVTDFYGRLRKPKIVMNFYGGLGMPKIITDYEGKILGSVSILKLSTELRN